ncbi:MAG TPA: hypothetical protein VEH27_18655 [Methylomirabilota bacterium]|nr:hypothetical protein [Methylomirabilota bacterium]
MKALFQRLLGFTLMAASLLAVHAADNFSREHDLGSGAGPADVLETETHRLERFEKDGHVRLFDLSKPEEGRTNIANQVSPLTSELLARLKAQLKNAQEPPPRAETNVNASELPSHVIRPQRDGVILLHARDVEIHGSMVRYEPQTNKNTIGYWMKVEDWVSWDFYAPKAGTYQVEILQGCGPKHGGSTVAYECNGQRLETTVIETKHFQDFITRDLGVFKFDAPGRYTLAVRPQKKPGGAVMDLRQVTLTPK